MLIKFMELFFVFSLTGGRKRKTLTVHNVMSIYIYIYIKHDKKANGKRNLTYSYYVLLFIK